MLFSFFFKKKKEKIARLFNLIINDLIMTSQSFLNNLIRIYFRISSFLTFIKITKLTNLSFVDFGRKTLI